WDRFLTTCTAMRKLATEAQTPAERARWRKAELALKMAEGSGRRLSAIRQLRWEKIDWDQGTIQWAAEFDKVRTDWKTPVPAPLLADLRDFQREVGAVGGWVFASETNPDVPMDRYALTKLLAKAEQEAGLPKLDGGLWHPYRRKWATERKHLALVDVAEAGGWLSTVTLATCYQQPTNDKLLAVMNEERKVRDVAVIDRR
ncbi:MAG TPA: tyrosine-type recombinase/integrase, partial [Gemmatimonadaceae bacterium]|nr:tyrosine-type recombinase/integrase [Gemmatimonadaceae bacterium]